MSSPCPSARSLKAPVSSPETGSDRRTDERESTNDHGQSERRPVGPPVGAGAYQQAARVCRGDLHAGGNHSGRCGHPYHAACGQQDRRERGWPRSRTRWPGSTSPKESATRCGWRARFRTSWRRHSCSATRHRRSPLPRARRQPDREAGGRSRSRFALCLKAYCRARVVPALVCAATFPAYRGSPGLSCCGETVGRRREGACEVCGRGASKGAGALESGAPRRRGWLCGLNVVGDLGHG